MGSSSIDGSKTRLLRNLAPLTHATYESHVKNYIEPGIGAMRLDRLRVTDVQPWLNRLATQRQCCAQGKDARRALHGTARCCTTWEVLSSGGVPAHHQGRQDCLAFRAALGSPASLFRFLSNVSASWCRGRARRLGAFSNPHARTPIRSTPHTCWCWSWVCLLYTSPSPRDS